MSTADDGATLQRQDRWMIPDVYNVLPAGIPTWCPVYTCHKKLSPSLLLPGYATGPATRTFHDMNVIKLNDWDGFLKLFCRALY